LAGDWIKFELATIDKPEVLQMAEILGTTSDDVVGKLLRVWGWFDQRSINGDAGGVTSVTLMKFIDRHVGSNGFAACMKKVGWLTDDGLPNFERHNGETAKNRALTNKRMKKMRNAGVTQEASPEKRREEKKITTPIPPSGAFGRFWDTWPSSERKVAKAACVKVWDRKHLDSVADQIVAHVEAAKGTDQWRKGFEPAPLTYLNQERWKDGNVAKPALPSYS
jgi:hypothetical protein